MLDALPLDSAGTRHGVGGQGGWDFTLEIPRLRSG